MRIKTFQGRSLEEVLPQIREELGPNAVVVGQRQKIQGGVAGFFGTKVIEVTAADSMPDDDELVALEDRMMQGNAPEDGDGGDLHDTTDLEERFRSAMKMGRRGGIDITDDWDPSQDAELAHEYGRVLEHAAASGGFEDVDLPNATATIATTPVEPPVVHPEADPLEQARALTARAHDRMQAATDRVEQAQGGTYAPPRAMPRQQPPATTTFAATVQGDQAAGFEPQAVPSPSAAATTVDHALRTDLGMPRTTDPALAGAISAAIEGIDLSEIEALRSAVEATRRSQERSDGLDRARTVIHQLDREIDPIVERLVAVGVDRDVIDVVVDTAVRHRMPFGGDQDIPTVIRSVVEELLQTHSGFPMVDRAWRMAFVGPAHGGRTTIAAKVAARYAATGMRVGIISIVRPEPGVPLMAERAFSGLDADVRIAADVAQAMSAAEELQGHDLVLVDTPAGTYLDPDTNAVVRSCLMAIGIDDVHVVLPLATSAREARSIIDAFRPLGANRLVIGRIDESRYIGEILNLCFRLGLPMSFLSDGPAVPDDLRTAGSSELAEQILHIEPTTQQ